MSDPTKLCVVVLSDKMDERFGYKGTFQESVYFSDTLVPVPQWIGYGYEFNGVTGAGQGMDWQDDDYKREDEHGNEIGPFIYGYEIASAWAGVIVMNSKLRQAIDDAKSNLRKWFPDDKMHVIVRGQQR